MNMWHVFGGEMKRILSALALLFLFAPQLSAEVLSVDLRFEPSTAPPAEKIVSVVKGFRGVRINSFTDMRSVPETYLGELRLNGQLQAIHSKTALSVYASDAFRRIYGEWGGKISPDGPLVLKGEITQLAFEESEGYQAKIGIHLFLLDDSGRILWDGHSSGIVRGTGKSVGTENISALLSDILRATYNEMLEDDKLVGVWSGRVSNTYVIRGDASSSASAKNEK